nr:Chain C, PROTEIN (ANTIGEN BOUND PEPTIDE) [synthetic construct]
GLYEWGGARIT